MLRSVVIRDVALVTKDPLLKLPAMMANSTIHDLEWCTGVLQLRSTGKLCPSQCDGGSLLCRYSACSKQYRCQLSRGLADDVSCFQPIVDFSTFNCLCLSSLLAYL
jgi:hypothetical protein